MADTNLLKKTAGTVLLEAGFSRKADSWYRKSDDAVMVVNLQKSQYGAQYYVNAGIFLWALGEADFPKENHCHIRFRLPFVLPDELKDSMNATLNLEDTEIHEDDRARNLSTMLRDYLLPFLTELSTIDGVRRAVSDGRLQGAMVLKQVKDL